jgi:hypothetical protein
MDRLVVSCTRIKTYRHGRRHALWLSTVLLCCSLTALAQQITQPGTTSAPFSTRATHLLGFANVSNNSTGTLPFRTIRCNSSRTGSLARK